MLKAQTNNMDKKTEQATKTSKSLIPNYTIGIVVISVCFCMFAFQYPFQNPLQATFCIIASILCFLALIGGSIGFYFIVKKKYGSNVLRVIPMILISIYIFSSMVFAACFSKYAQIEKTYEKIEKIVQISWTIYGVSIAFYAIIIGLPNLISLKKDEFEQSFASNILDTINPIIYSTVCMVVSTLLFYCFFDNSVQTACNWTYTSFILNIFSIPYYLAASIYLLYKSNRQNRKIRKIKRNIEKGGDE